MFAADPINNKAMDAIKNPWTSFSVILRKPITNPRITKIVNTVVDIVLANNPNITAINKPAKKAQAPICTIKIIRSRNLYTLLPSYCEEIT